MNYTLNPVLSVNPNTGVYTYQNNSWITVGNDVGFPLYAQAIYLTNPDDLKFTLSAGNVDIGEVHIIGRGNNAEVDVVVDAINNTNSMRVLSQDLESTVDDITIGDKNGNFANVNPSFSALQTIEVNPLTSIQVSFLDSGQLDAFGRLRVSEPSTLLDTKSIYQKNSFIFDEVLNGSATSVLSTYDSSVDLATSTNGDYAIRQTRMRFNYQPGKSMQYMFTGLIKPETNIIKRIGAFQSLSSAPYTPSDGMYLEVTSDGPSFNIIKTQGTPYTMTAPKSAWNVDKLDGTGPSGLTIDFNNTVLFSIDYEWLGVGRIRFGFYLNGKFVVAHADTHSNGLSSVYMTYSNQPVRYEIRQTGTGSGLLRHICSTVIVDGATENVGKGYAIEDGSITVQSGEFTPILALKLNPQTANVLNIIKQVDILNLGNASISYGLFINPTITGGSLIFSPVATNSSMLSASGNGGLTVTEGVSGYRIMGGYAPAGASNNSISVAVQNTYSNEARFGCGIKGDTDTIVLAAKGLGATASVYGTVGLLEKS